jgi:hypothetical protein
MPVPETTHPPTRSEVDETAEPAAAPDWQDAPATPKQMNWVRGLPQGERTARERFGVPVEALTKRQAYELILEGRDA